MRMRMRWIYEAMRSERSEERKSWEWVLDMEFGLEHKNMG
jgi:hypothetical protein